MMGLRIQPQIATQRSCAQSALCKLSHNHESALMLCAAQVRFFESVQLGCLPVTFSPAADPTPNRMPFDNSVHYDGFSINVPPDTIPMLRTLLVSLAANRTRLRAMQRALWHARPAFDWSDMSGRGAMAKTLEALAARARRRHAV